MHVSAVGLALIKRNEGCVLHAYPDPATGGDPWTIGYGCTGPNIRPGLTITQAQAEQMLADRLAREFEPGVLAAIGNAPTTQAQFDAMVSLAFNIGIGAFRSSHVCSYHRAGNYTAAADAFASWNHAAGRVLPALTRRRLEEEKLYLSDLPVARGIPETASENTPPSYTRADAARVMQGELAKLGLYHGLIDGIWGKASRTAYNLFNNLT